MFNCFKCGLSIVAGTALLTLTACGQPAEAPAPKSVSVNAEGVLTDMQKKALKDAKAVEQVIKATAEKRDAIENGSNAK